MNNINNSNNKKKKKKNNSNNNKYNNFTALVNKCNEKLQLILFGNILLL